MFEPFSQGYDLGRFYVYPLAEGERHAKMSRREYEQATIAYCPEGESLIMKLGTQHFTVTGDGGVSAGTLGLPLELLESAGIQNPPELVEILVVSDPAWFEEMFFVG